MLTVQAASWACFFKLVSSSPTVSFPINAQVPPVARIASSFSFVFAENTFTSVETASSATAMTYSLVDPPSWLSINSSERWLHGSPQDSDVPAGTVVGINFGLMATDDTGSTTSNVTLVVSRNSAPTVEIPIAQQLANSGLSYSEPSSILSYPNTYFNISFSPSSFSQPGLNYYAVSGDNSPLPSWISFDPSTLRFSGTSPPSDSLIEPPQTFDFQLIASDVTGFSAAFIGFSIVVGSREITADNPTVVLKATVGKELVYNGLQNGMKIDGQVAGPSNLTAKVSPGSSPPDWLTFDTTTWELHGTPPSSAQNSAFSIFFFDALADSFNVTFQVDIDENGTIFRNTLPDMQAQRGSEFRLYLAPYLVQTDGVMVDVQTKPQTDWFHFNTSTFVVSCNVPISETASSVSVSVRATLDSSKATESETFMLQIMPGTSSNNATTSTSATTSQTSATSVTAATTEPSSTRRNTILLAVLIPVLLLFLVLAVLVSCYCQRRRQKRRELQQSLTNKDISDPVPFSFAYNGQEDIVSSMRALDKEYKVSNLNSAKKQIDQEKAQLQSQADGMPVGIALALSSDDSNWSEHDDKSAAGGAMTAGVALTPTAMIDCPINGNRTVDRSGVPNFPAPPSVIIGDTSSASPSSSAVGSSRSGHGMAAAAGDGQWPFEESTVISSIHSRHSSESHPIDDAMHRDALGILGCAASPSLSKKASGSLLTRQTVRTSTPMQLDIAVAAAEASASKATGNGVSEHVFASQEAIVHGSRSSMATVVVNGSRSSVMVNENTLEAGGVKSEDMRRKGFLSVFASRIANRFKKGFPLPTKTQPGRTYFSTAAGGRNYSSPDQASFDTDLGSVTFGNITTAQPYKPRPVFIGSIHRINEESPQPNSTRWNREYAGSRASGAIVAERGTPTHNLVKQQQALDSEDENDNDSSDGESLMVGSDAVGDEAIRLDPPRPVFLGLSNAGRESSDLSQDIARSLSSGRPSSGSSAMSGISAAMEEVRSLLLLPTDSPASRHGRQSRSSNDLYSPLSNSWETLPSSEPNWTSIYDFVLPGQESTAAAPATAIDGGSDEPPTPATGVGLTYGVFDRPQQPQMALTGSPGSAAQHQAVARAHGVALTQGQAQQMLAKAATAAPGSHLHEATSPRSYGIMTFPETDLYGIGNGGDHSEKDDDNDLATGHGYRHTSSYYGEPYAMINNDYEYPPPFVAGDGAFHHYDAGKDDIGKDGSRSTGSRGSIGLAMSKYSQPKMTHASLVSNASSGIRAFI
ncbi:polarity establishment/cellular polarization [Sporothrix epigloea]|uniref:Polarity establishment/cellular polarization n=1 Tax=Sporothrix epigloea TaxID=1892477 RepID=A0ABP0DZE0_9PEZI